jgi:hypothetical protein
MADLQFGSVRAPQYIFGILATEYLHGREQEGEIHASFVWSWHAGSPREPHKQHHAEAEQELLEQEHEAAVESGMTAELADGQRT